MQSKAEIERKKRSFQDQIGGFRPLTDLQIEKAVRNYEAGILAAGLMEGFDVQECVARYECGMKRRQHIERERRDARAREDRE